eukprot:6202874-Amphidinium_carterae.1
MASAVLSATRLTPVVRSSLLNRHTLLMRSRTISPSSAPEQTFVMPSSLATCSCYSVATTRS